MDWWEVLLITVGISLDIFAAVECQGALAAKVDRKQLMAIGALVAAWQMLVLFLGSIFAKVLTKTSVGDEAFEHVIVIIILGCLGARMLLKAVKNEGIIERRVDKMKLGRFFSLAAVTSAYTFLAGAVLGFMGCSVIQILLMIGGVSFVFVVLGMYTGYHFGFEQKSKVYIAGGILLIIAGIDVAIAQLLAVL